MKFLVGRGAGLADAEDAVQTVFMRVLARWVRVEKPRSYFQKAVMNELVALAKRRRGELDTALRWAGSQQGRCGADDVYHQGEVGIVRDSLAILPPRQREVMAMTYEGHPDIDGVPLPGRDADLRPAQGSGTRV